MYRIPGHPQNHDLRMLKQLEHSIEAQLEIEHQLTENDRREIDLATCFPAGKLMLHGTLEGLQRTLDPDVFRSYVIQDGERRGVLYINTLRKKCIAVDSLTHFAEIEALPDFSSGTVQV